MKGFIIRQHGWFLADTLRRSRRDAVRDIERQTGKSWDVLRDKYGYRAVRVEVRELAPRPIGGGR
jgi:hypothetical protein